MTEGKGDILNAFEKARKSAKRFKRYENTGKGFQWDAYESPIAEYEITFHGLGEHFIHNFLQERIINNKPSFVIDIASGGRALRDLAKEGLITAGLSVGLTDPRTERMIEKDKGLALRVLEGDILQGKTWAGIKDWLALCGRTKADLIMSRAVAGFSMVIGDRDTMPIFDTLAKKALSLVSSDGGMLLTDVPRLVEHKQINRWIEGLKSQTNYQITYLPFSGEGPILQVKK